MTLTFNCTALGILIPIEVLALVGFPLKFSDCGCTNYSFYGFVGIICLYTYKYIFLMSSINILLMSSILNGGIYL